MARHLAGPLKVTTVELPLALHQRVKVFAAVNGLTLRDLHAEALTQYIEARP